METEKKKAAIISISSNSILIVLKIITGIISGSISIISEAIHSLLDIFASVLTFFAVSQSNKPADSDHPYGHGKYEDMAGFVEGSLIVLAGLYILYEVIKRIITGYSAEFEPKLCIIVMAIAVIANIIVSNYVLKIARKTQSIALYADSHHLKADVYSSFGVLCGFLLIKLTGINSLDAIIACIVATVILRTGIEIIKKTINNLLDGTLPAEDLEKIKKILDSNGSIKGYKNLMTRQMGQNKDVKVTLLFSPEISLCECHKICDEIEKEINNELPHAVTVIHAEPFEQSAVLK